MSISRYLERVGSRAYTHWKAEIRGFLLIWILLRWITRFLAKPNQSAQKNGTDACTHGCSGIGITRMVYMIA